MGEIELLALYWTVAGPAEVHYGREWSLFDWRDRCAEAARVGCRGLGLWHADIEHQLQTSTLAEMKGSSTTPASSTFRWSSSRTSSRAQRRRRGRTRTGGASCCSTPPPRSTPTTSRSATSPGTPRELGPLTEAFAELCSDAANHTHRSASKQGAFSESLNIASLWKLPIVYVMENNSYNVVTRVEQEEANTAAGEPLAVKAAAFSVTGVTVDGGDPIAVCDAVKTAVARWTRSSKRRRVSGT
jgi:Dehydrogenase E1 component